MKLYSITVFSNVSTELKLLAGEFELSNFGYFQRGSVQEFLTFFSKTVAERTKPGHRQSVEESSTHLTDFNEGLSGIIITDSEYPQRVAFSLVNKVLEEFLVRFPKQTWTQKITFPELREYLIQYQDPKQGDQIMKVQEQLDETKQVMNKTIESLLQRGEKLDDLIDRSRDISFQSKAFYKQAKKTNSCCVIQ
ncbi:7032_t:CDS:2 [Paraglomus brasilianum]|uniref:Synaptobrevin homolog YKT6 n=1 Tax=Paraglomus brasilianum TaxID=144538 RepID=A0A9N9AC83_9GLOM|nr:7032_t:CDS:2 [Paraglomus brasilianum]